MKLIVLSNEPQGVARVKAEGSITATDFPGGAKDPLELLLGPDWKRARVLLDFSAVTYIDSSAIGWLIETQRLLQEGGGMLVVHSIQTNVRQILDVLKVGKVVPMAESESEARALIPLSPEGRGMG